MNDAVETKAIKAVFGERVHEIPVNATKSMTGHLLSAGAGIEIIAVLLSFEKQRVHPTINYEAPDPECDLDYVVDGSRDMTLNTVLKNSFGNGRTQFGAGTAPMGKLKRCQMVGCEPVKNPEPPGIPASAPRRWPPDSQPRQP